VLRPVRATSCYYFLIHGPTSGERAPLPIRRLCDASIDTHLPDYWTDNKIPGRRSLQSDSAACTPQISAAARHPRYVGDCHCIIPVNIRNRLLSTQLHVLNVLLRCLSLVGTGFQSVNECRSNWPVSCTSHYMVTPPCTWPIMSSFSLTVDSVSFDQPTTQHALSNEHKTVSTTDTFMLPDPESGSICHRNCYT